MPRRDDIPRIQPLRSFRTAITPAHLFMAAGVAGASFALVLLVGWLALRQPQVSNERLREQEMARQAEDWRRANPGVRDTADAGAHPEDFEPRRK